MPHSLTWLPDVLKIAGLKVSLVDGWENRGRGNVGRIFGVICHHTAGPRIGNMPSLGVLINGRAGLPGPLAQLGLARDGTFFVIAAGRANHAGKGIWRGVRNGNSNFIGIEAENTGLPTDSPWPEVQVDAYHRGVAAILKHIGQGSDFCAGHKEYALPLGRKPDPDFNMNTFRSSVAAIMSGTAPTPVLIPAVEPTGPGATAGRPTLRRGMTGQLTEQVQRKVGVNVDGNFGAKTEAAVRAFQRAQGLVADGIVGPKTWRALDSIP
jgi:peptidoglycan hydrolase-like protein with peptidoglycan-binding domain